MKKLLILIILLLVVVGCDDNKVIVEDEVQAVTKIDESKDYLESKPYKSYTLSDGNVYNAAWIDINLSNEEMSNLNLTLKNNILLNTKSFEVLNGMVSKGTLVNYKYYMSDKYLSIVEESVNYFDGNYGSTVINVYNIEFNKGIIVENKDILKFFKITEDDMLNKIKEFDIPDVDYVVMYIKNNGYSLYVNNENKLQISFVYVNDEEEIKKELVFDY